VSELPWIHDQDPQGSTQHAHTHTRRRDNHTCTRRLHGDGVSTQQHGRLSAATGAGASYGLARPLACDSGPNSRWRVRMRMPGGRGQSVLDVMGTMPIRLKYAQV